MSHKLADLAPDLTKNYPRSARDLFGGYIIAGRMLDKCRALSNGTLGEYNYGHTCRIDQLFLEFTGIQANEFKAFVATGATDDEVASWIQARARPHSATEIAVWNFSLKCGRISELPPDRQLFIQEYMLKNIKPEIQRRVILNFDMLDAEEGRLG